MYRILFIFIQLTSNKICNSSEMTDIIEQSALPPSKIQETDGFSRAHRFNAIFSSLRERNTLNSYIIDKFIKRINKRHAYIQQLQHLEDGLQKCIQMGQTEDEEQKLFATSFSRSSLDKHQNLVKSDHGLRDSKLLRTNDTVDQENQGKGQTSLNAKDPEYQKEEKKRLCSQLHIKGMPRYERNFTNFFKQFCYKDGKDKQKKIKVHRQSDLKKQVPIDFAQTPQKCINIKSLIFGSQDLNFLKKIQANSYCNVNLRTQANNFIDQSNQNHLSTIESKFSNNFLPTISKGYGKAKKKELFRYEKKIKSQDEGKRLKSEQYAQQKKLTDTIEKVGVSFRINTIQIKKYY